MKKLIAFALLTLVVTACSKKDDKNDNPLVGTTWTGSGKVSGDFNENGVNESLRIDISYKFDKADYTSTVKVTVTESGTTSTVNQESKGKYDYDEPFVTLYDDEDGDAETGEIIGDQLVLTDYEYGLQLTLTKK